jgi:hypothetical protein
MWAEKEERDRVREREINLHASSNKAPNPIELETQNYYLI